MKSWIKHAPPLVLMLGAVLALGACDEKIDSGLACPALCPQRPPEVRDTVLFAVELDTSIAGYPALGAETRLLLAAFGDTLDARAIVRYDSLPTVFRHVDSVDDSVIVSVDSARLRLAIARVDTLGPAITIELYDVDVAGDDTSTALLTAAFTPERLLGSETFSVDALKAIKEAGSESGIDTLSVPIDNQKLLDKITSDSAVAVPRLRVGIRIVSAEPADLLIFSSNAGGSPLLSFRPSPDSTVRAMELAANSLTPDNPNVAFDLSDFQLVAKAPADPPSDVLRVGGLPARRAYLRFDIPSLILDSSSVVRTTLLLTQRPNPAAPARSDSVAIQPFAVGASANVTDIARALLLVGIAFDSTRSVPESGDVRAFEIITLMRIWRGTKPDITPRAVALRTVAEGERASMVDFYSNEAPAELRPRLLISFIPQPGRGLP